MSTENSRENKNNQAQIEELIEKHNCLQYVNKNLMCNACKCIIKMSSRDKSNKINQHLHTKKHKNNLIIYN